MYCYGTNHHNLSGPRVSHMCNTCGVNHARIGFLDSTHMYMHMQYLHTHIFYMCVHACMDNVASQLASYLPFNLS